MIDTNKYEGHSPAPWHGCFGGVYCDDKDPDFNMVKITRSICRQPLHFDKENGDWVAYDGYTPANIAKIHPDQLLIADAPRLLEEVKRLQKQVDSLREYCHKEDYDIYNWEVKNIIPEMV